MSTVTFDTLLNALQTFVPGPLTNGEIVCLTFEIDQLTKRIECAKRDREMTDLRARFEKLKTTWTVRTTGKVDYLRCLLCDLGIDDLIQPCRSREYLDLLSRIIAVFESYGS